MCVHIPPCEALPLRGFVLGIIVGLNSRNTLATSRIIGRNHIFDLFGCNTRGAMLHDNVVCWSKLFGLADIRVGYFAKGYRLGDRVRQIVCTQFLLGVLGKLIDCVCPKAHYPTNLFDVRSD